jgi:transposase
VGVSRHTLYAWKKRFDAYGRAGLEDQSRGAPSGSRLPEVTRRAILMMKEANQSAARSMFYRRTISGTLLMGRR